MSTKLTRWLSVVVALTLGFASVVACGSGKTTQDAVETTATGDVEEGAGASEAPAGGEASSTDSESVAPAVDRSVEDIAAISADFTASITDFFEAWNAQDPDALRSHWNANTVFEDTPNLQILTGEDLAAMPEGLFISDPEYRNEVTDVFVSQHAALMFGDGWGVSIRGQAYTEDDPFRGVDRIVFAADGTFESWTAFVTLDAYERARAPSALVSAASDLLESHQTAWESGDSTAVAALYAADAQRVDSLLDATPENSADIAAQATEFFDAFATPTLTQIAPFSDNRATTNDPDRVGAIYRVESAPSDSPACTVTMAVLLSARDGLIVHEEVFWDADSLIACNWFN